MRECVAASGSEALLQRIIDHVKASCVWLKKDAEREEYALDILAGRIYRQGHAWSDFSTEGICRKYSVCLRFPGREYMICEKCGRALKDAESIQRGYGPVCYKKIMPPRSKKTRATKAKGDCSLCG